jgi:hypothetical protein
MKRKIKISGRTQRNGKIIKDWDRAKHKKQNPIC